MSTTAQIAHEYDYIDRAREVFIRVTLIGLMAVTCFLILRSFIPIIAWGIIIAVAIHPGYRKLAGLLHGRDKWAAIVCTLLLLSLVIVPAVLLAGTLMDGIRSLVRHLQNGDFRVPPPPASIRDWPLIGKPLNDFWSSASTNLEGLLSKFAPQLQHYIPALLSASARLGMTALQFVISILLAGYLVVNNKANARFARLIFDRVFGAKGAEFEELTAGTVRSVTNGILGVAFIQSIFAGIGFLAVGLPGAGMWAAMFLVASVLQIGPLVMLPAVIYAFTITSTGHAVIFLIWCAIVGLMDNVLKPLLLGRGSQVPALVIFLGVIGGFVAMGIVGLFVGAIILSVGYKLMMAWLQDTDVAAGAARPS